MRHVSSSPHWGFISLLTTTRNNALLTLMQADMLINRNQGETMLGFSQNRKMEFAGAYSQNRKVETTRVESQHFRVELEQASSSNWILAVGFLSAMIFLNCRIWFFYFKNYRTDMFKLTGTHRLVITSITKHPQSRIRYRTS